MVQANGTDPLQTEIFWRLCGDPPPRGDAGDWTSFALRPGALFLVGDPKQAIYRFRGADIAAYVRARETFRTQAPGGVLSISTNFRSCPEIMRFVNRRFERPLSTENGQPGFRALDPFREERGAGPSVAALDVAVADDEGKATALQRRDGDHRHPPSPRHPPLPEATRPARPRPRPVPSDSGHAAPARRAAC